MASTQGANAMQTWPRVALLALALLTARTAYAEATAARTRYEGVARVVAFADVHGALHELQALLREAGVTDARDRWVAGRAHVVSLGDLLDRGADSRKVMDLLMGLQAQARAAGGGLHVVVGNHEAMNVLGDLRYVDRGEYAAYADLEPAGMRAGERMTWLELHGPGAGASFDDRFPPGYFGHRAALGPDGRYGRWILGLPVAVVINDTLFMHAGPSPVVSGMDLEELNRRYRAALLDYQARAHALENAGLLQPGDAFRARPQLAAERLESRAAAADADAGSLRATVDDFSRADGAPLLGREGPNWYRGAALCREASEADVLYPLLRQFGATRLVVGHTTTRDRRAATRFDGRVVKLDAGMNRAVYQGRGAALFIAGGKLQVRHSGEGVASALEAEPLFVAPDAVDDPSVAAAVAAGHITLGDPRGPDAFDAVVQHSGRVIPAVFVAAGDEVVRHELAAYRLDRLLGLGLVPATAAREVHGRRGYVQARPQRWLTQGETERQGLRGAGWCALEPQLQLLRAFDVLTGNPGRTPETLLFDAEEWYVYATAHGRAFGNEPGTPAHLRVPSPRPGAELRQRLAALTDQSLADALGDALDAAARTAILQRRDRLLAPPMVGTAAP